MQGGVTCLKNSSPREALQRMMEPHLILCCGCRGIATGVWCGWKNLSVIWGEGADSGGKRVGGCDSIYLFIYLFIYSIHRSHLLRCWLREIPMSLLLNRSRSVKYVAETHLDIRGGCWRPPAVLIFLANTQPIRCIYIYIYILYHVSPNLSSFRSPVNGGFYTASDQSQVNHT